MHNLCFFIFLNFLLKINFWLLRSIWLPGVHCILVLLQVKFILKYLTLGSDHFLRYEKSRSVSKIFRVKVQALQTLWRKMGDQKVPNSNFKIAYPLQKSNHELKFFMHYKNRIYELKICNLLSINQVINTIKL